MWGGLVTVISLSWLQSEITCDESWWQQFSFFNAFSLASQIYITLVRFGFCSFKSNLLFQWWTMMRGVFRTRVDESNTLYVSICTRILCYYIASNMFINNWKTDSHRVKRFGVIETTTRATYVWDCLGVRMFDTLLGTVALVQAVSMLYACVYSLACV